MDELTPRRETRLEAAKAGRTKLLGRACPTCESEVRYVTSGQCVGCTKERSAQNVDLVRKTLREAKG